MDFRLEVGRTTFFSWGIERLRVLLRFLGFRTSLSGVGQDFLICVTSPKFLWFSNEVHFGVGTDSIITLFVFENLLKNVEGIRSCRESGR